MRVISSGSLVAMPHAANMLADFGAEVIHIERPGVGDTWRFMPPFAVNGEKQVSTSWAQDARNRLSLTLELNLRIPEVKELFFDLIKESDVFMENMVWLDKYGISDDDLLQVNPKLIIAHISGYGRPEFGGDPEICDRASYDMIGQAFSGFMHLNGDPEPSIPALTKPWANDYISALHCVFGVLAAYVTAIKTGKGQVVDIAQFESCARIMADTFVSYTEANIVRTRTGSKSSAFQPYGLFQDKNGEYVAIGAFGAGVYARFVAALGIDAEYFNHNECAATPSVLNSEKGKELDRIITEWVAERTAKEVEDQMAKFKVPCSKVNTAKDVVDNQHWLSRNDFIKYEDQTIQKEIKALGIIPKLSETPGKVWRGAPTLGQDTDDILTKVLQYNPDKIKALKDKKLI
ncbi:CaiB/BaiF CoA transferase family protein [Sporomusa sphaeroides]|uniref:CaiB/BaiF CoA transferase family protein n=1 Tax=Sporomusa sphaeroides TaxID=47679 RepID=UPI002546DF80|nr:CoA transferase [Sporomusa sphaeroides]